MSHVDDGQLNALLDNELSAAEASAVHLHLAGCAECARRLEEARAFLAEAGELLAVLTPALTGVPLAHPAASAPVAAAPPVAVAPPAPPSATRAEELGLVAPLARGPGASGSLRKSGESISEPAVAKTSKEIAVSIDGRTAMTPAIRPVTWRGMPAVPGEKRPLLPSLEKLAWAASLILALGVGYLVNEVYQLRNASHLGDVAANTDAPRLATPAQPAPAARGETRTRTPGSAATRQGGGAARPAVTRLAEADRSRENAGRGDVAVHKPPGATAAKAAPAIVRRPADQIASNQPVAPAAGPGGRAAAPSVSAPSASGVMASPPVAPAPTESRNAQGAGVADLSSSALRREAPSPARALTSLDEAAVATTFRRITLEEAVRRLSGSIRLIDGMQPSRVEGGPGRLVQGADPERDVVRIIYTDQRGARIVLDQQIGDVRTGSFNGLMQGDTLVTSTDVGGTRVRWVDRKFWLSLTGGASADSVRALVERIR